MEDPASHAVFSDEVISFVRQANDYSTFLEERPQTERSAWVREARLRLAGLYYGFSLLPVFRNQLDEALEQFVTEEDWNQVKNQVLELLGRFDDYLEVFDESMQESEGPVVRKISDDLADIYQDIKDFVSLYHISTPEIMNDALAECQQHFVEYWGQKAVNVLRALHNLEYGEADLDEEEEADGPQREQEPRTDHWIISRRMQEFRKGLENEEE